MPRPIKCRQIACGQLRHHCFKPHGMKLRLHEAVVLKLDEIEAIRLADLESLYQADAAVCMGISRQTFGTILLGARHKIARALIEGKPILLGSSQNHANTTSISADASTTPRQRIKP